MVAFTHIVFIFLLIYKHTQLVQASFKVQKSEHAIESLKERRQELTNELYALKDHTSIKQFAQKSLNFKEMKLNQVSRFNSNRAQI